MIINKIIISFQPISLQETIQGAKNRARNAFNQYKSLWDLPGGKIEFGETPEEALKRELLEESALFINQFEFRNFRKVKIVLSH